MDKKLGWKDAIYLALGLVLITALIVRAEPGKVLSAIRGIDLTILGLVILLYSMNLCVKILRWSLILKAMGSKMPGWIAAPIFLASLALNNSTPGKIGGEPVRALLLREHTGSRLSRGLASIFAEKALDILTILLFSVIGMLYLVRELGFSDVRGFFIGIVAGSVILVAAILLVVSKKLSHLGTGIARRVVGKGSSPFRKKAGRFIDKGEGSLSRFHGSISLLFEYKLSLLFIVILDLEIWINEAARLYLVILALPASVGVSPLGALAATSIANILGFILPIGSGNVLGSSSVLEILTGNERISASASVVAVATSLWLSIPLGLISLSILRKIHPSKGKVHTSKSETMEA